MFLKIYFNDKPVFLTDKLDKEIEQFLHQDDTVFADELTPEGIDSIFREIRKENIHRGIYYHPELETLKEFFMSKFSVIRAAGGLVEDADGKILFIFRKGKWDLPKGKLDPDESPEVCAERELKEETGIKEAVLLNHLITTYHTYNEEAKNILKETAWYRFKAPAGQQLHPQTDEQIEKAEWVNPVNLSKYTDNTYELIKDVLSRGGLLLSNNN